MKTKLFLATLFLFSVITLAQDKIYGKPEILLGKNVKIIPVPEASYNREYTGFYTDEKMSDYYKGKRLINPLHLENRVFKVIEVTKLPATKYTQCHRIKIQDVANDEVLYYNYSKSVHSLYEYYFEVVGGLTYPEGFFCNMVVEKIAGDGYKIYSNYEGYVGNFIDKKINLKTKEEEYTLYLAGSDVNTPPNKKGIVLTLENGSKINFPLIPYYLDKGQYKTILTLNKSQVEMLSKSMITDIKMGGLELRTNPETLKLIHKMLPCMIAMK